jgi:hypothetical protein
LLALRKRAVQQLCAVVVAHAQSHCNRFWSPAVADQPYCRRIGLVRTLLTSRRIGIARPEAQRLAGYFEDPVSVTDHDPKFGSHSWQQQEVRIWCGNDCRIGDDVLHDFGSFANLENLPAEGASWISVHRELGGLAHFQLPDIGLVDLAVDLHLPQIIRDLEQCFGFETDGDRLSWIDIPLDDDSINRRTEHGVIEIKFRLIDARPPLLDDSLRILEIGLGHVPFCLRNRNGLGPHLDLLQGCAQVSTSRVTQSPRLAQISLGSAAGAGQCELSQELPFRFVLPGLVRGRLVLSPFFCSPRIRHCDRRSFQCCLFALGQ